MAASRYLRRLQEAAAAAAASQTSPNGQESTDSSPPPVGIGKSPTLPPTVVPSQGQTSPFLESSLSAVSPINANSSAISPSRYPIAADFHPHYPGMHSPGTSAMPSLRRRMSESSNEPPLGAPRSVASNNVPTPLDSYSTYPLYNWSASYKQQSQLPIPPPNALPPLSYYYRPHRLEDVAPRETIILIVYLLWEY